MTKKSSQFDLVIYLTCNMYLLFNMILNKNKILIASKSIHMGSIFFLILNPHSNCIRICFRSDSEMMMQNQISMAFPIIYDILLELLGTVQEILLAGGSFLEG